MFNSSLLKQLTYYPIIAALLLILVARSDIAQSPKNYRQMGVNSLQSTVKPHQPVAVKVAQIRKPLDQKTAQNSVWNLSQVRHKAKEIEQLSKGSIRLSSIVDSSPNLAAPYYQVRVVENHPDRSIATIYWFRVWSPGGVIEALDLIENQYIPLSKWNPDGR